MKVGWKLSSLAGHCSAVGQVVGLMIHAIQALRWKRRCHAERLLHPNRLEAWPNTPPTDSANLWVTMKHKFGTALLCRDTELEW